MVVGLALVKWPHRKDASTMPLYEGVTVCMLTALSVLALLGLRYPVTMLPMLLFESAWKALWLLLVALPHATGPGLDTATVETLFSCRRDSPLRCEILLRPLVGRMP